MTLTQPLEPIYELQQRFPNSEECSKIIEDSLKCDGACMTTGKCPTDLPARIMAAKMKLSELQFINAADKF